MRLLEELLRVVEEEEDITDVAVTVSSSFSDGKATVCVVSVKVVGTTVICSSSWARY